MSLTKISLYCMLLLVIFVGFLEQNFIMLYILFMLMIIDCKNSNVRALAVILILHIYLHYETDYIVYIITADFLKTGPVVGDIILNTVIFIKYVVLVLAIFYRENLTRFVCKLTGVAVTDSYLPTKADLLMIRMAKYMALYTLITTLYMIYLASGLFFAETALIEEEATAEFKDVSRFYADALSNMGKAKLVAMALITHTWATVKSNKVKIIAV